MPKLMPLIVEFAEVAKSVGSLVVFHREVDPNNLKTEEVVPPPDDEVGAGFTVRVNVWTALGFMPLLAVIVNVYVPEAVGVPLRTPLLVLKLTPLGKLPDSLKVGAGVPVSAIVKLPAVPAVKVVLEALVMLGATPVEGGGVVVVGGGLTGAGDVTLQC